MDDRERFANIAELAGEDVARKICDGCIYYETVENAREVHPEKLDNYLRGARVVSIGFMKAPTANNMVIYLRRPAGNVFGLLLSAVDFTETQRAADMRLSGFILQDTQADNMGEVILMDERRFKAIEKLAGTETARNIDDAETFNKCMQNLREVKPETLDGYLRGAVILAIELVDEPLTDGIMIYLQRPTGEVFLLDIDALDADGDDFFGKMDFSGVIV